MGSSSHGSRTADRAALPIGRDYFDRRRAMIDAFVSGHFTWPGTLRLHRAALGWDLLRAPVNALLSPILVLTRIAAYLCRRAGWRGCADWLGQRRLYLRTAVGRKVEALIAIDLLGLPLNVEGSARDPSAMARAVLTAPQFREIIRTCPTEEAAEALGHRVAGALGEYAASRSAVAEMTTTLCVLVTGALVFQAVTPGMISMAPGVADAIAQTRGIATFPLGRTLGGIWYGTFGVNAPPWLVGAAVGALVMIGSVVAAFAGVFADPVQGFLGIHRRRLRRLLDAVEGEMLGRGEKPFVAREHFYARILDLWDAVASALRVFRN